MKIKLNGNNNLCRKYLTTVCGSIMNSAVSPVLITPCSCTIILCPLGGRASLLGNRCTPITSVVRTSGLNGNQIFFDPVGLFKQAWSSRCFSACQYSTTVCMLFCLCCMTTFAGAAKHCLTLPGSKVSSMQHDAFSRAARSLTHCSSQCSSSCSSVCPLLL